MKKTLLIFMICTFTGCLLFNAGIPDAVAAEKIKYGGILKFNSSKGAGIFGDPLKTFAFNHSFCEVALQCLLKPSNTKMGSFEPELATSWKLAPDKSNYLFTLQKGVKFHDGTDFNAQAVKWNLDRWIQSERPRLDKVKSIDVLDSHTIRLNLSGWDAVVLADFMKDTFIISPTAYEKKGAKWAEFNPVGTGAFKLAGHKRNIILKFEKFEDYWEKGLPYLDGFHITMIVDPVTAIAVLKHGEVDALVPVDGITADQLKKEGKYTIIAHPAIHNLLQFNSEDPTSPWSDKRMRMALEYAIDKKAISDAVGRGYLYPVYEIVHSIPTGAGTTPRKYNPEKARQLIKEAGYSGLKIEIQYMTMPSIQDSVVAIQKYLKDVGIEIVPVPLTPAVFMQKLYEPVLGNDLLLSDQRGGPAELIIAVDETLAPGSVFFQGTKRPEGFNELIDIALRQDNINEILKYFFKLEKLAYDECMFVPLWGNLFPAVQYPYVKNAQWFYGGIPYMKLRWAWLDK